LAQVHRARSAGKRAVLGDGDEGAKRAERHGGILAHLQENCIRCSNVCAFVEASRPVDYREGAIAFPARPGESGDRHDRANPKVSAEFPLLRE
jgi:hypothetical protein